MKNTIKKMIKAIAGICALAAVFAMSDNTGGTALAMSVVAGVAGGKHVINEPLTVALTNVESPDLLVNEIDRRLVKSVQWQPPSTSCRDGQAPRSRAAWLLTITA